MMQKNDTLPKSAKRPQPKGGSRKGKPNKVTATAKDAIALAAEKLGGAARLVEWAKEDAKNEHAFWATIYPKLLPLQVNAALAGHVGMTINVQFD